MVFFSPNLDYSKNANNTCLQVSQECHLCSAEAFLLESLILEDPASRLEVNKNH